MFSRSLTIGFALAAMIAGSSALAQFPVGAGPVTFNFATPQFVDPTLVLIFTAPGTKTASGSDLLSNPAIPYSAGTEVHSRILGANGGFLDINSLRIEFDYDDQISINPPPGPPTPGYVNWTVQSLQVINNHYDIVFVSAFPPFSAPINDNFNPGPSYPFTQSFAGLGITGSADALAAFVAQNPANNVKISTGSIGIERLSAVPEPGAIALVSGLGVTLGGWLLSRRRRK